MESCEEKQRMAARPFPFPAGSPKEEIAFLVAFVNGDWDVWRMDSMREVFLHVHTISGSPATNDAVYGLREEAWNHLHTIASGGRPEIRRQSVTETIDETGRRHRVVRAEDFTDRVQRAVLHLLAA